MTNKLDKKIFNYMTTLENTNGGLVSKGFRNIRLKTYILILLSLFIFFGCAAKQEMVKPAETIPLEPKKPVAPEITKVMEIAETSRAIAVVFQKAGLDPRGIAESVALYSRMIAVVIGIDRYPNLRADDQLKFAVHDAKGMEKVLRNHYPFDRIIRLYNEEATKERIMKVLQGDLSQVGSDDAVLIYFAGHGITLPTAQGDLGYLVPYDGSLKREEIYKNISMQQIKADVCPLIPAKHVLIIADACFGGLLLATRSGTVSPVHKTAYLREITREPVRQIITAGGKDERVLDGGLGGHSVFTGRLIEALEKVIDFITARELGVKIQQQVYGDAAARGHKQRPLVGEIYGTGDFVFVPDASKKQEALEDQVKKFEEELAQLEHLKKAAQSRKEKARIRELERQRLLKEAALRQARLRKEAAKREVELRAKAEEEARRDKEGMRRREKERKERLAYLKLQTQRLREELGSPARALGLDDAVTEAKRINKALAKMEADFAKELDAQLKPLREYHGQKIAQAQSIKPWDKMFETEADYTARVSKQTDLVQSLQAELTANEQQIKNQLMVELAAQKNPLMEQMHRISEQEFALGAGDVQFRLQDYVLEEEGFLVHVEPKKASRRSFLFLAFLPVPKAKARDYWHHPGLLVPEVTVGVKSPGIIFPKKMVFYGPEGAAYVLENLMRLPTSSKACEIAQIAQDGRFIAYDNGTMLDANTGLQWIAGPDRDTTWDEAKSWVESLSLDGGGWRMPTIAELKTLYEEGTGKRNMTPLLKTYGWWVWSGETKGSSSAWGFVFRFGFKHLSTRDDYLNGRAFAVRSLNKLETSKLPPKVMRIGRDGAFIATGTGVVIDTRTGLMWAAKDKGKGISWDDAKLYCENYQGGGYSDWRMPTQDELASLYDPDKKNPHGYRVTKLIHITACCPWASETRGSKAAYFTFYSDGVRVWGLQSDSLDSRALPVRDSN